MALQGTLETFALPDVLRLLDTTKNTGCLVLNGDGVSGSVHLSSGKIVAADSTRVADHRAVVDVVFDLLRFAEGTFSFDENIEPETKGDPVAVDEVLVDAEAMLVEWRDIEKVVPSLDHWVTLATDLPGHEVIVSSGRWRTIAAVGSGRTVRGIGDSLDLGEVDVSRTVKDLIEAGLAVMGEDVGARTVSDRLSSLAAADTEPSNGSVPSNGSDPTEAAGMSSVEFDAGELAQEMVADNVVPFEMQGDAGVGSGDDPLADAGISADDAFLADVFPGLAARNGDAAEKEMVEPAPPSAVDFDDVSDEDLSRQLANLSPKAAAAVHAAASASTEEERDAALDEVVEDDEDINRGLLLKFLGSVNN
ncbi:MAG TPA: DUF4388 domain-containing protein [Acidimicrobiales bacterium]|nr:DUF4388 domain-containing protein [Acidimicrobiales bacterium]